MKDDKKPRRLEQFWFIASAVLLVGAGTLVLLGKRTFNSWLLLAVCFANFMTFALLRKARQ